MRDVRSLPAAEVGLFFIAPDAHVFVRHRVNSLALLAAENRILKAQSKGRLKLSDTERATLAEIGHRLGRKVLGEVAHVARPDTILGWYRRRPAPACSSLRRGFNLTAGIPVLAVITTKGGSRYATSIGGTLTGRGADLIIVDDPLKAEEAMSEPARKRVIDWFAGALVSRLNDKGGRAVA
jgi:hypothetical protein